MVEGVEISIFFDNTHKKYHILAGILSFVFMKKFAYRTEDSGMGGDRGGFGGGSRFWS